MNKSTFDGFVKRAQEAGISLFDATNLFKQATGVDPSAMMAGGGAGGPPPQGGGDPSQGAPDISGGQGIPPELEQLIQQLPPEVLQQLVQEIEAEIANGQGGAGGPPGGDPSAGGMPQGAPDPALAGGPPGGGMPPMDPSMLGKQGSILAKEASYIEGFVERGLTYGFNRADVKEMYKKALSLMEPTQTKVASVQQTNVAANKHFEGFMLQARAYGISDKEAAEVYQQTFGSN